MPKAIKTHIFSEEIWPFAFCKLSMDGRLAGTHINGVRDINDPKLCRNCVTACESEWARLQHESQMGRS